MDPADHLDELLAGVEAQIRPDARVLELGCRRGPLTGVLADRAAHVTAFEIDPAELSDAEDRHQGRPNVRWLLGDGETLSGVADASVDVVLARELFRRLPGAKLQLAHVEEMGRVLAPGGTALFVLSTDPASAAAAGAASRRDVLRTLGGVRQVAAPPRGGTYVPLEALGTVAVQAGLDLERMDGSGTSRTVVLARRA
jgi:SAM-dependent methyltransferase